MDVKISMWREVLARLAPAKSNISGGAAAGINEVFRNLTNSSDPMVALKTDAMKHIVTELEAMRLISTK